jgi:hypothetical protein
MDNKSIRIITRKEAVLLYEKMKTDDKYSIATGVIVTVMIIIMALKS